MRQAAEKIIGEPIVASAMIATPGKWFGNKLSFVPDLALLLALVYLVVHIATKMFMHAKPKTQESKLGNHEGLIYLAVSKSKIVCLAVKEGWFSRSLSRVLLEHPRDNQVSLDVFGKFPRKLRLSLDGVNTYTLESMDSKDRIKDILQELGYKRQ